MNQIAINKSKARVDVRMLTMSALLAAVSYVLAFIEFHVPLSPSFTRMDLSDFPALIGAVAVHTCLGTLFATTVTQISLTTQLFYDILFLGGANHGKNYRQNDYGSL